MSNVRTYEFNGQIVRLSPDQVMNNYGVFDSESWSPDFVPARNGLTFGGFPVRGWNLDYDGGVSSTVCVDNRTDECSDFNIPFELMDDGFTDLACFPQKDLNVGQLEMVEGTPNSTPADIDRQVLASLS